MRGNNKPIFEILHQGTHYMIPTYQRDYQWGPERWQALVRDILVAETQGNDKPAHWLGIFLTSFVVDSHEPGYGGPVKYEVIDGQQRLTTLAIWISALVHHASEHERLELYQLENMAKITVQESDRIFFQAVLDGKWRNLEFFSQLEHPILRAYTYFRYLLWHGEQAVLEDDPVRLPKFKKPNNELSFELQWAQHLEKKNDGISRVSKTNASSLLDSTMRKLSIYALVHEAAVDESQAEIFDTLNGMRQELEPLDHIRNSLFVRIQDLENSNIYKDYWKPAETALRSLASKKMKAGTAFIYDYVISKGEKRKQGTINRATGASHFATMIKRTPDLDIAEFIKEDFVPAMLTWQVVVRDQDSVTINGHTRQFSQDALFLMDNIRDLSVGPTNPVVLHYALGWVLGSVSEPEFLKILNLLENYLVRQTLGGRPMSPLRARMMDLMGAIDGDLSFETLHEHLAKSDWVTNKELFELVNEIPIYQKASAKALGTIFRGIERQLSGPGAMRFVFGKDESSYSFEHIFPQDGSKWIEDLENWAVYPSDLEKYTHVLGNLTVVTTRHNSAVGNKTLAEKQQYSTAPGNAAPLSINRSWLGSERWTPSMIEDRSIELVQAVIGRWPTIN